MGGRNLIQSYIDGWLEKDERKILSTLSRDCEIIESHGPRYVGKEVIEDWITDWFGKNGEVVGWDVTSYFGNNFGGSCEWTFSYRYEGKSGVIDGCTVFEFSEDKITQLKEYRRTKDIFAWTG